MRRKEGLGRVRGWVGAMGSSFEDGCGGAQGPFKGGAAAAQAHEEAILKCGDDGHVGCVTAMREALGDEAAI